MHKMIANAVAFEHPMQKIYTVLPPPIEEMDEATHSVQVLRSERNTDIVHSYAQSVPANLAVVRSERAGQ